jgi:hypothetical protein
MRAAPGDLGETESLHHFIYLLTAAMTGQALHGEGQVLPESHVREQSVVLKHVSALPLAGPAVDAGGGIEQNPVVEKNSALIGLHETGDAIEGQSLPRPACAEENGDALGRLKLQVEAKASRFRSGGKLLANARVNQSVGPFF